jgi:hypothetical protein
MDDPRVRLQAALKEAMVSKDLVRRDVIRMALSAIKQIEIDTRRDVTPEDVVGILQKEIKSRRESIEEKIKFGRADDAEKDQVEAAILEGFLPEQLSREQIEELVRAAIAQTGATSQKEIGKVMGVLMPQVKGKADGGLVNQVVRELLS